MGKRRPNPRGSEHGATGAPIGFAFSDCGGAVAVVRQSQWHTTRDISKPTAKTEAVSDVSSCCNPTRRNLSPYWVSENPSFLAARSPYELFGLDLNSPLLPPALFLSHEKCIRAARLQSPDVSRFTEEHMLFKESINLPLRHLLLPLCYSLRCLAIPKNPKYTS